MSLILWKLLFSSLTHEASSSRSFAKGVGAYPYLPIRRGTSPTMSLDDSKKKTKVIMFLTSRSAPTMGNFSSNAGRSKLSGIATPSLMKEPRK
jgi:hypothetical protein